MTLKELFENASAGASSAGAVASVVMPIGHPTPELVKRITRRKKKTKPLQVGKGVYESCQLNERFPSQLPYDAFGWFRPSGTLVLATKAHAASSYLVTHEDVLEDYGMSDYEDAFDRGWVRWALQNQRLSLQCYWSDKRIPTILRGVANLKKKMENPEDFKHFIGRGGGLFINEFLLDLMKKGRWDIGYVTGASLSQLFAKADDKMAGLSDEEDFEDEQW